ncbi:TenA family protein [Shimia marina]|uniref:Aminopyrimidine aminohydrolase n=1 Tax=Shimia marina TaxID=321267 RepID=A0A0N7LSH5_9RHOB|nr:TenA family protein [Shimia marina]CUH53636.1 Thiaminase-2 [Shimia marina]SFD72328.1 thiaminase (transcriptional activator TenA) [Shimia marina]
MRPTDHLRSLAGDDWIAATTHPFCTELADGTLPLDKMRWYLAQDYQFVGNFVRLLASAIAHAPTLADSVPAAQFLALVTGPENTYFLRSFEALGMDEAAQNAPPAPPTEGFNALMAEAAASGRYELMLAVLVVAEWVYLSWATPVNPPKEELPFYFAEWITLHAGEGFEGVVEYLRGQLDITWDSLSDTARSEVETMFLRAAKLERAFWDASYAA